MVAMTDGTVSGFRPVSHTQKRVAVFSRAQRSGGLRRRSSRRSVPVRSASTNCDTTGRNLPVVRLPCGQTVARPGPPRTVWETSPARVGGPFRNGNVAESGVFRIPPRPAVVPSLDCRCRDNGRRGQRACGAGAGICQCNSTWCSIVLATNRGRTVATEGGGSLTSAGARWAHSKEFPVAVQRSARREAFLFGAPPAGQDPCHARVALQRGPRSASWPIACRGSAFRATTSTSR